MSSLEELDGVVEGPTSSPLKESAAPEEQIPGTVESPAPGPPGREREAREMEIRGQLTQWTILLFAATVLLGFVGTFFTGSWTNIKALLDVVVPVESLLIGGVVGYFFGTGGRAG